MSSIKEILPQQGELYQEETLNPVLCKAKLLPLKSITLQKLEKMQREAQETVKKEEMEERKLQAQSAIRNPGEDGNSAVLKL
ncbi:DgyrCDS1115 [Dimorphilus gyrociliatus]|uniref:DgyrCDS1115 n=1 Tax=Dimorphilus gyrociliatus TaxID=2664684 RepID=A0A7I8V7S1_9ANNE|nr:DgyrCDS1115 [Dimorphilus gyrociliatus]